MDGPSALAVLVAHASGSGPEGALRALSALEHDDLRFAVALVGEVLADPVATLGAGRVEAVVRLADGTGFAEAATAALEQAGGDHRYVLLLHDDAFPDPEVVGRLIERCEAAPDVAAAGAKLVEADEPEVLQEVGGSIDRFAVRRTGLEVREVDHGQHDDTDEVLFCSAACLLVRREALDEVGGLDPDAWPLYEDVDLCWRLRAAGHRVVVVPEARVRHGAAMSRGRRIGAGEEFGELGLRIAAERGRLRFMLKNYGRLTLALILPQYALLVVVQVLSALVGREFWRLRCLLRAWGRLAKEAAAVREARSRASTTARVEDQDILRVGAHRAIVARRYERVAVTDRLTDGLRTLDRRVRRLSGDPVVWAGLGAALVVVVALRSVLFGGTFTLGTLRPPRGLGAAIDAYLARPAPEGLSPYAPTGPGILLLGALRSVALGSTALAQKFALLLPVVVSGFGAGRLGRVLGLRGSAVRWLAVGAMVSPITLVLLRGGYVGSLVTWAATMWVAARLFGAAPVEVRGGLPGWLRREAGWALGWAVAIALHPPALVWLLLLGAGILYARRGDGGGPQRIRLLATGIGGAFVVGLPWSLSWASPHGPLFGPMAGFVEGGGGGLQAVTFGAGWPLLAWVGVALGGAMLVGVSRSSVVLAGILSLAWLAGVAALLPDPTALVAVGWCAVALLAIVARGVGDALPTFELGWRHAAVIGIVGILAVSWGGGAIGAVAAGADPHRLEVVPSGRERAGTVLWLLPAGRGVVAWSTDGFTDRMSAFPVPSGRGEDLVLEALDAARSGATHRLGAVLALGNVSHVVALRPEAGAGLSGQADLAVSEEQGAAVVYRNEAWRGPGLLLAAPPIDVLGPAGLANLARSQREAPTSVGPDGAIRLEVPETEDGVLYLAVGGGRGWRVGDEPTRAGPAGVWTSVEGLPSRLTVEAPSDPARLLYPVSGLALAGLVLLWLAGAYLVAPDAGRPGRTDLTLQSPELARPFAYAPVFVLLLAGWLAWPGPGAAAVQPPFLSAGWYCPPVGEGLTQRVAIANPDREAATYLVRESLTAPPVDSDELPGRERATIEVDAGVGAVVESYGRRTVVASIVEDPEDGTTDTAPCSAGPEGVAYFAEGGRGATRAIPRLFERYVVYNPFPELARASVRFFSPDESISPPALQDVRVPSGAAAVIDPEDQFFFPLELSTEIRVWQGRAVVARRLVTSEMLSWSLGVGLRRSGIVPRGQTAGAVTELIFLEPGDGPAQVTVDATGDRGSVPQASFEVRSSRRLSYDLQDAAPEQGGLVVRLQASDPVAVETLVVPEDRTDLSLLPLLDAHRSWAVPVGEGRRLAVTNPGTRAVRVELVRLGSGGRLEGGEVEPSGSATFDLPGAEGFGVLVRADGPVTVAALGGDGALPGVPLP